jgi:Periplasmic protein involved in polysaccharide export
MRPSLMVIFASLICLAGCTNDIVSQPKPGTLDRSYDDPATYKLTAEDKVKITVFGENDLSGEYVVGADGTIAFPLISSIKAAGSTPDELRNQLEARLGEGFLTKPRITVSILEYRPFYILGEVNQAGQYPWRPGMTVVTAIATARGFSYRANKSEVLIQHLGETEEKVYQLTPSLKIRPGDTVRLKERFF